MFPARESRLTGWHCEECYILLYDLCPHMYLRKKRLPPNPECEEDK